MSREGAKEKAVAVAARMHCLEAPACNPCTPPAAAAWGQVANFVSGGGRLPVGPEAEGLAGVEGFVELIGTCWQQDPALRPAFSQLMPQLR